MSCCPPGSWPALEEQRGTCNGTEVDFGDGVKAYVVKGTGNYGLISFQDIYQYDSGRCKAVADQFAETAGFTVVHINFAGDQPYSGDVDMDRLGPWVKERSYAEYIQPKLVQTILPYMKETLGVEKIAAVGYCWGCYIALQACADPQVSIAAATLFHPALGLNAVFGKDPECKDVAEHVHTPILLVPAGNDPDFVGPAGSVTKILQTNCPSSKSVVMKDMVHGFVIRGDVSDPAVKRDVKEAIELATAFLKEQLA